MDVQWSRNTRNLAVLLLIASLIWLIYMARILLGPLIVAAFLAYVLNPLVNFVNQRTKLPRSLVVMLLYLGSVAVLVGLGVALAPVLVRQSRELIAELSDIAAQLQANIGETSSILGVELPTGALLADAFLIPQGLLETDRVLTLVNSATTNIVWVAVILIVTFYLLLDWDKLREWLIRLAPPDHQSDVRRLYQLVKEIWQAYLRGQLVLMLVIGVVTWIALAVVGVPAAAILGVLTGALDAILSVGPVIAMIIAALVAWFQGSTYLAIPNSWLVVIVLAIYGAIQTLENVWLRPRIMGRRLQMHPAVVFLAIIAALVLVGPVAALIILPVIGTAGVIGSYLRCRILGLDPWARI